MMEVVICGGNILDIVFTHADKPLPLKPDGALDLTKITTIKIIEVVDYH